MSDPREVEKELWKVYDRLDSIPEAAERAALELKALELVVKIRSAGEKVKPAASAGPDSSVRKAQAAANGARLP